MKRVTGPWSRGQPVLTPQTDNKPTVVLKASRGQTFGRINVACVAIGHCFDRCDQPARQTTAPTRNRINALS